MHSEIGDDDLNERIIVAFLREWLTERHQCFSSPFSDSTFIRAWIERRVPFRLLSAVSRLAIVGDNQIYFIEIETYGAKASEAKQEWKAWCAAHGQRYCVALSVDDVRVALEHWRIPLRAAA